MISHSQDIIRAQTGLASTPLAIARRNTGYLIAFLYLQDIFWLSLSRVQQNFSEPIYQVEAFEWSLFLSFCLITIVFACVGFGFAQIMRPIKKIQISHWVISSIILTSICLNIASEFIFASNVRYVSGGLTGAAGILYGIIGSFKLMSMVLLIRAKKTGQPLSNLLLAGFLISIVLTIDGLANALTLGMFGILMLDINLRRPGQLIALAIFVMGVLWIGFISKFNTIPEYLTPAFMTNWVIGRFAIQAEQMYTFLSGQSVIGNEVSYWQLVGRAISDRFDLIMGNILVFEYPRSISEAMYYDMHKTFDAGSSPGMLLGTALQGPFFFIIVPFIVAFVLMQFFYGILSKATLIQICAYSFIFKTLHANFSEYMTIISPTLLSVFAFVLGSLMIPKISRNPSQMPSNP